MYFEEIFEEIRPLLKEVYYLENAVEVKDRCKKCSRYTFPDIEENHKEVKNIVSSPNQVNKYSIWGKFLISPLFQAIEQYAIEQYVLKKKKEIHLDEIPIALFELYFESYYHLLYGSYYYEECHQDLPNDIKKILLKMNEEYKGFKY